MIVTVFLPVMSRALYRFFEACEQNEAAREVRQHLSRMILHLPVILFALAMRPQNGQPDINMSQHSALTRTSVALMTGSASTSNQYCCA